MAPSNFGVFFVLVPKVSILSSNFANVVNMTLLSTTVIVVTVKTTKMMYFNFSFPSYH